MGASLGVQSGTPRCGVQTFFFFFFKLDAGIPVNFEPCDMTMSVVQSDKAEIARR